MKSKIFSRNDLLFYYNKCELPINLLTLDSLTDKECLFSDKKIEPEVIKNPTRKRKLNNCYVIESKTSDKKPFENGNGLYNINNNQNENYKNKGNSFSYKQNFTIKKNDFEPTRKNTDEYCYGYGKDNIINNPHIEEDVITCNKNLQNLKQAIRKKSNQINESKFP